MRAAVEVAAAQVDVAERLVVRDQPRAESRLLRRGEAEEELRRVRDEIGARNTGGHRHLLRQALLAVEAAARKAAADARRREDAEVVEDRLARGVDVLAAVAAQQHGDVVALEERRVRVAREAAARQQHRLARAMVERQVRPRLPRHALVEVRQPPRDRDAEPRRVRRVPRVERLERSLEIVLGRAQVVDS